MKCKLNPIKNTVVLAILITAFTANIFSQNSESCSAFSEGCWTLIGASNGVELYVTHKKYTRPNMSAKGFNIIVYSKLVNTNDYPVETASSVIAPFYFYDIDKKLLVPNQIEMDKNLGARQTIIKYSEIFTNLNEIMYSQIRSFVFVKKNTAGFKSTKLE